MNKLSDKLKTEIDHWLKKFPADQKQSAVLPALRFAQEENGGWLTDEIMREVADYLSMPFIAVYEVASFYSMYELKPVGKNKLSICTNISCMLAGCDKIVKHLHKKLNINLGETTEDQKFTLKEVECLGACANAPVMHIGHKYYEDLTPEKVDKILEELK
ncbi:MAG TPA: NADH-quinone oxidoreductase subunit NuoE [Gammaproteobacteria bacterium]|nr:NADH-quinone oxidoreductase subunit NuoE [Gammaproteobacteria bacterium]